MAELLLRETEPLPERETDPVVPTLPEALRVADDALRETVDPVVLTEEEREMLLERETPVRPVVEARRTDEPLPPERVLPPLRRVTDPEPLREVRDRELPDDPPRETKLRELRLASR